MHRLHVTDYISQAVHVNILAYRSSVYSRQIAAAGNEQQQMEKLSAIFLCSALAPNVAAGAH